MSAITELLVVTSFGPGSDPVQSLLLPHGIRVRHADGLATMKAELTQARADAVLVDRWLRNDEAAACVALARGVFEIPAVLMATGSEISEGRADLAEAVDAVVEKPLQAETLLAGLRLVRGRSEGSKAASRGAEPREPTPARGESSADSPRRPEPEAGDTGDTGDTEDEPAVGRGHGALRLLDDVRETLRRLGEVIKIDTLSGLLYRDFFVERVAREVKRAVRYDEPLSALMIDIDDFKAINDRHGHETGNEILGLLGRLIDGTIRRDLDLASRLYGDEFCVVLPATGLSGAGSLARRLARLVAERPEPVPFTISVGVHCLSGGEVEGNGVKALLDGADQAMLAAKRRGKGLLHFFGTDVEPDLFESGSSVATPGAELAEPAGPEAEGAGDGPAPALPVGVEAPPQPAPTRAPAVPVSAEASGPPSPPDRADVANPGAAAASGTEADESSAAASDDVAFSAALDDAMASLADEEDLKKADDYRGKVLLVSYEPGVAGILVDFLTARGLPVETAPDFAAALTLLDSLEFFLVLGDAPPHSAETAAFCAAAHRIDPEIFLFLFVDAGAESDGAGLPGKVRFVRKPFLLSELYLEASRAREDYHLRHLREDARPEAGTRPD